MRFLSLAFTLVCLSCCGETIFFTEAQNFQREGKEREALALYEKAAKTATDPQEIYNARLQMAGLQERLNRPCQEIEESFELAFKANSSRAEPLYYLGTYYRRNQKFEEAVRVLQVALTLARPQDVKDEDKWIYDYGCLFHYSICAYWAGLYPESVAANEKLLALSSLPADIRQVIESNSPYAVNKLRKR